MISVMNNINYKNIEKNGGSFSEIGKILRVTCLFW